MTEIKGVFAASMSILDKNLTLDLNKTIIHAENLIDQGCHGVAIFGSTGQAQLISISEKISLLNNLSTNKYKDQYIIGTGLNSLGETINLMKIATSLGFDRFLIMPPAYYNYGDNEVIAFYPEVLESRRQDLTPPAYIRNGSIYAMTWEQINVKGSRYDKDTVPYIMPEERTINIDEPIDLELARIMLK